MSMKLLIDTQGKRVLFAEVGKDCVDFLFHILSLPVATIISLPNAQKLVGSLSNLYQSLETLNDAYILPDKKKDIYLKPIPPVSSLVPLLALTDANQLQKKFYKCNSSSTSYCSGSYMSDDPRATCPSCGWLLSKSMTYVPHPAVKVKPEDGGLVKGVVTYMVMDDLMIMPISTISSITILNKFNIKDLSTLEEKDVTLGMDQALKLVKTSMHSKKVLTEVFF
ncbi:uncharacterized protein LOC125211670 [Salvia hispanica]|uniref:uncharacterized protein LOC125211670 n=1 Tax=Salvia hispanica TaxID=49212 RepID=UPI00200903BA|nr:uncharacterized protein LOC125211670 [Salvia hispanica]